MEEVVGKLWDKWLTKQVSTEYADASVELADIQSQLIVFYRAMGGDASKTIELAEPRKLQIKRSALQKIAGSHQYFMLCWQDARSIRLPPYVAHFADKKLNENLYFWLVALAAHQEPINDWLVDNQAATIKIIARYPGLKRIYLSLSQTFLANRPTVNGLTPQEQKAEKQIRYALTVPGAITCAVKNKYAALPVPLWLYPPRSMPAMVKSKEGDEQKGKGKRRLKDIKEIEQRKQVEFVDDERKTDGLLVFQAEALETWTEQVNLDRCQSEDDDTDDVDTIAKDLDIITLSRHRKAKSASIRFNLDLPAEENDDLRLGEGILLPEWNFKQQRLVKDKCQLQTMLADNVKPVELTDKQRHISCEITRRFASLGLIQSKRKAQPSGSEIDLDAWLDDYTQPVKSSSKQNYFIDNTQHYRDVSCLILADISLSTEAYINQEQRVIDVIIDSLMVFSQGLNQLSDELAIYGFSSVRSQHVRYHIYKNFNMQFDSHVRGRIARIEPGYYTRIGAAIRQSSKILSKQGSTNKVMLIITDGRPNDLDQYEGRYGLEDTRQAVIEAKNLGLIPYCVTIDKKAHDYLPFLFGQNGFSVVDDAAQLPLILPKIYINLTKH
ncbi:MAG: VWA domain-containing protein [Oceanospirillaceae bacterium]